MSASPRSILVALTCLSACADARGGELACQQRLVEASGAAGPSADPFGHVARALRDMDLKGCSDEQRGHALRTAEAAQRLAVAWRRIGDPVRRMETDPELRSNRDFRELQALVEGWEARRRALRRRLEQLGAE